MKKNLIIVTLLLLSFTLFGQFNHAKRKAPIRNQVKPKVEENVSTEDVEVKKYRKSFLEINSEKQYEMRKKLSQSIRDIKSSKKSSALFIALSFAFLYGVLHSMGPGHGKVFMVGQVIASPVKYLSIVTSSFVFAFLHSLSGLTLVLVLKLLSKSIMSGSTYYSMIAQNISFYILIILGLFMLKKAIWYKPHCHKHDNKDKSLLLTAITIGFVPCPGSIIIAVYAMKMDMFSTGIMMISAMALGMATTLVVINSVANTLKNAVTYKVSNEKLLLNITRVMTFIGALFVISMGILFLVTS